MTKVSLGRMERVDDLRTIWESDEFGPWLAQEELVALLGELLGLNLVLEGDGHGAAQADVLCRDAETGGPVLIEGQLDETDHAHLGQVVSACAGRDAVTVLWIASRFAEAHRAALAWLNAITPEQVRFFGLEIELWRIGDSPVAPKFDVVSAPPQWASANPRPAVEPAGLNESQEINESHLAYWQAFRTLVNRDSKVLMPRRPRPYHWMNFAVRESKMLLGAFANTQHQRVGGALVRSGPHAKAHFHELQQQQDEIEQQIGEELEWREMSGQKWSWIYLMWHGVDPTDEGEWPGQHTWLLEKLESFCETFAPRV